MTNWKVHPLIWGFILLCLVSLILGLGWLEIRLPGGFPLGTVATWGMLMATAWALLRYAPRLTRRRQLAWLGLILSISWYPFSIWKAGNVELTFSGNGQSWVVWTAIISGWLILLGLWTAISEVQRRRT